MNLKVSIVVPVFNSEKTLSKCLDSLINQTYKDIEIICVNDCSKDRSLQVLQEYASKDSRIIIVNHTENKNAGGARNSGIKEAKGSYICFVDNDDWLIEDGIKILVDNSNAFTSDVVAADWVTYFDETHQKLNDNLLDNADKLTLIKYICKNGFRMLGVLMKKRLFCDNELFFPEKVFYEDNAIAMALISCANVISYIKKPIYYYFISPSSVTGFVTKRKITDRMVTNRMYLANLKRLNCYTKELREWYDFYYIKLICQTYMLMLQLPYLEVKSLILVLEKDLDLVKPNSLITGLSSNAHFIVTHPRIAFHYYYIKHQLGLLRRRLLSK